MDFTPFDARHYYRTLQVRAGYCERLETYENGVLACLNCVCWPG